MHSKTIANSIHIMGLIENIEVSRIKDSKNPVRKDLGDINNLLWSIKEKGLLQPIVTRFSDDEYEIVAGNRRFLACKRLGWRKIPCHVVELSDEESFEVALIENIQRKTMNAIEEANAYKNYVENYGWGGASELARRIGMSQEYVTKRIKLLELPEEIRQEIIRHRIKPSMAEELSYVKDKKEQSELAKLIVQRHITIKKFRASLKGVSVSELQDDYKTLRSEENQNMNKIFDNATIALKLAVKRMNELMELVKGSFVIYEFLLQEQKTTNEQIDRVIKSKKKYSKLVRLHF